MSNMQIAKLLGWTSMAVGATELAATQWLQDEMGVRDHESLLRAFGLREMATGATILAQPGVNRSLAVGLWARVVGDALDLAMLGLATRETKKPQGLATVTSIVLGVTGLDLFAALAVEHNLAKASRVSTAARRRVSKTQALPKGVAVVEQRAVGGTNAKSDEQRATAVELQGAPPAI